PPASAGGIVHNADTSAVRHDRYIVPDGTCFLQAPSPPAEAGGYQNVAANAAFLCKGYCFWGALTSRVGFTQSEAKQRSEKSDPIFFRRATVSGNCKTFSVQPFAMSATVSPSPAFAVWADAPLLIWLARAVISAPCEIKYMMTSLWP